MSRRDRGGPKDFGFVPKSRKQVDGHDPVTEYPSPWCERCAWDFLLLIARYRAGMVEGIPLERGEFLASTRYLARRWRKSVGWVHRYLRWMVELERIVKQRSTPKGTVYFVVNYEAYNSPHSGGAASSGTPSGTPAKHVSEHPSEHPQQSENLVDSRASDDPSPENETASGTESGTKKNKGSKNNDGAGLRKLVAAVVKVWNAETGGSYDFGRAMKELKRLHGPPPTETVLAHLREYFRQHEGSKRGFVSLSRFVSMFGVYAPVGSVPAEGSDTEARYRYLASEARRGVDMGQYPDWSQVADRFLGREGAARG